MFRFQQESYPGPDYERVVQNRGYSGIKKKADGKVMVFILENGFCRPRVARGLTVVINRPLLKLMGLSEPAGGKYFTKGEYDGFYYTDVYLRLRLSASWMIKSLRF